MNLATAFQWMLDYAHGGFMFEKSAFSGELVVPGLPGLTQQADAACIFRAADPMEQALFIAAMQRGAFVNEVECPGCGYPWPGDSA